MSTKAQVDSIEPGTPEWDESEIALEQQRRDEYGENTPSKPLVSAKPNTPAGQAEEWGITQKGADILNLATKLQQEQPSRYPTYQDALIRALFDIEQAEQRGQR